ncbi:MAG: hypothetical protein K2H52_06735 [Lachnospiraceae bacterium]|nr:hypothetical protein [Lachnospiraceae bacterium]MDE6184171.1 hypothetical protein [Lachnospiraceae bacterium]
MEEKEGVVNADLEQKEIVVTTEFLRQKQEEWKEMAVQAEQLFCEAADSVKTLEPIFYGKPVLTLKTVFLDQKEKGIKNFERLLRHLEKLDTIAFVYEKVERENRGFIKGN